MTNQVSTMSELAEFFCTAINPGFCSNMTYKKWKNSMQTVNVEFSNSTARLTGCTAQLAERRSLAGELTLSCARPSADG